MKKRFKENYDLLGTCWGGGFFDANILTMLTQTTMGRHAFGAFNPPTLRYFLLHRHDIFSSYREP